MIFVKLENLIEQQLESIVWKLENYWPRIAFTLEHTLEKEMAIPWKKSSILAWRVPWTEEPGMLQAMGSQELDTT